MAHIHKYKHKIEGELETICSEILDIIKNDLIPHSESDEGKVFYYKMKGDYHRYLAEFQAGDNRSVTSFISYLSSYLPCDVVVS